MLKSFWRGLFFISIFCLSQPAVSAEAKVFDLYRIRGNPYEIAVWRKRAERAGRDVNERLVSADQVGFFADGEASPSKPSYYISLDFHGLLFREIRQQSIAGPRGRRAPPEARVFAMNRPNANQGRGEWLLLHFAQLAPIAVETSFSSVSEQFDEFAAVRAAGRWFFLLKSQDRLLWLEILTDASSRFVQAVQVQAIDLKHSQGQRAPHNNVFNQLSGQLAASEAASEIDSLRKNLLTLNARTETEVRAFIAHMDPQISVLKERAVVWEPLLLKIDPGGLMPESPKEPYEQVNLYELPSGGMLASFPTGEVIYYLNYDHYKHPRDQANGVVVLRWVSAGQTRPSELRILPNGQEVAVDGMVLQIPPHLQIRGKKCEPLFGG